MRYLAALIIFSVCSYMGFSAGEKEKKRKEQLFAFLRLFYHVKNQINSFSMPTKEIYKNFSDKTLSQCGFLDFLNSRGENVYVNQWENALKKCEKNLCLSQNEKNLVYGFGKNIGKSGKENQIKNFDYYISETEKVFEKLKSETSKKIKAYRALGFSIGAMIALLII